MDATKFKKLFRKIWNFLIHEDSWQSFVADAILIVLIGKFLLFPGIGLAMGTAYPVVAVVSNSMNHQDMDFDDWWLQNKELYLNKDISQEQFNNFYSTDGFDKGDVIVIKGTSFEELEVGDVIVFSIMSRRDPIIHRIVTVGDGFVATKGDANLGQISFERQIYEQQIHGKAVLVVPYLGWVKVGVMEMFGML
jgi:hypothetical protein